MRAPRTSAARALASTATSTSAALLIDSNTTLLLYEITVCFGGLGAKPPAFLAVLAWTVKCAGGEAAGPATNDAWAGSREPFWDGWPGGGEFQLFKRPPQPNLKSKAGTMYAQPVDVKHLTWHKLNVYLRSYFFTPNRN